MKPLSELGSEEIQTELAAIRRAQTVLLLRRQQYHSRAASNRGASGRSGQTRLTGEQRDALFALRGRW